MGIDGPWADKEKIRKYLSPSEFIEYNLEKKINLEKKYDLVLSLEVAEHLSKKSADVFVGNLTSAGDIIVFSASIPFQEGQNHINEQWIDYWEAIFLKHGFEMHDVLKPIFWDNPKIFWWYKQNMVLFTRKDVNVNINLQYNVLKKVVHYDWYLHKAERLDAIISGNEKIKTYLKYLLMAVKRKFKSHDIKN